MKTTGFAVAALAVAGVALALHFWPDHPNQIAVEQAPEPSLAKTCLQLSEGLNTFQPSEVEKADFCAPGGAFIQQVTISNREAWEFSRPWLKKGARSSLDDRLAFARKTPNPEATSLTIQTAQGVYHMLIASDSTSSARR